MKKIMSLVIAFLMIFSMFSMLTVKASPGTIYVPDDYPTIQDALDVASSGDTVFVRSGTYNEYIVVEKAVSLVGEDRETTIIDGSVTIIASYVKVTGFTIQNGRRGIYIDNHVYKVEIVGNNIRWHQHGIWSEWIYNYPSTLTIADNFVANNDYGIWLRGAYISVTGNQIANNNHGLVLYNTPWSTLKNNVFQDNNYNFWIRSMQGHWPSYFDFDIDTSNTINGKPVYYWVGRRDAKVPSNAGYIGLVNCQNITVESVDLRYNGQGLLLAYSTKCTIDRSTITDNKIGVYVHQSSENLINQSTVANNQWYGIWLQMRDRTDNNRILDNVIENNGNGVHVDSARNTDVISNYINHNDCGISVGGSSTNVTNNLISNNQYGIKITSLDNVLRKNIITENTYNLGVFGGYERQDIDTSNTVNSKKVYYWIDQHDTNVPPHAGYIGLVNCTNITVDNLEITNNGQGVLLAHANNTNILRANLSDNEYGIYMEKCLNNLVSSNNITTNNLGIYLGSSHFNNLTENKITDNGRAIYHIFSNNNTINHNYIKSNKEGMLFAKSHSDLITKNEIISNGYGIFLLKSSKNDVEGNLIVDNYGSGYVEWPFPAEGWSHPFPFRMQIRSGIFLYNCSQTFIHNNFLENNNDGGVYIYGRMYEGSTETSLNNTIILNTITSHRYGLILIDADHNNITQNNVFTNNYVGIGVIGSNNFIYYNDFTDNTIQAIASGINTWDSNYPSGGNYWSDYTGADEKSGPNQDQLGSDGIGDTPYVIDANNQDNYPLMNPLIERVDWKSIKERAENRSMLYELYHDLFSASWWDDVAEGLVQPIDLYNPLKSTATDLFDLLLKALAPAVGKTLSTLNTAYDATVALIEVFKLLESLKYETIAEVLETASVRYDVVADLADLVEIAGSVIAACEQHDLDALMASLEQEKEKMEDLYKGTVEFEEGIWYYLKTVPPPELSLPGLPPPYDGVLLTYMNEHIYLLLVRYPHYYYKLDLSALIPKLVGYFDHVIKDGHLSSLRAELEANYLDITNLLGDLNFLDEVVDAPLNTRYVAPLAESGYWTANEEEVTWVEAGTEVEAHVIVKPYESMAVSGTVTVEIWQKFGFRKECLCDVPDELYLTHEEPVELSSGNLCISVPFTAEAPYRPVFEGYYMKVYFSGEGIRNDDVEKGIVDVQVSWEDDPPVLRVPPAIVALFTLASPANMLVMGPDGLRVGYDPLTGTVVNEIEGATYSGPGTEPQVISIPYPLPGVYIADIFGTGTGSYTLVMEFVAPDGSIITETYGGEIVEDAVYVYTASITFEEIAGDPKPTVELEHLKEFIDGLPDSCFDQSIRRASHLKKALFNKIDEVILKVEAGIYADAINKLVHDIRVVMDGDSTAQDWIVASETQSSLCVIIDHIISSIETLQQP